MNILNIIVVQILPYFSTHPVTDSIAIPGYAPLDYQEDLIIDIWTSDKDRKMPSSPFPGNRDNNTI